MLCVASNRPEHGAADEPTARTDEQPVGAELGARVRRAPDACFGPKLGPSVLAGNHGEVPSSECKPHWRACRKVRRGHLGAESASRGPEPAQESNHEFRWYMLRHDAEPRAFEVGETNTIPSPGTPCAPLRPQCTR